MVLFGSADLAGARFYFRLIQQRPKVQVFVFPVAFRLSQQHFSAAHHFVDSAEAQFGHIFAYFLCNKMHKVDDVFRFALELFTQLRVLGSNAHRAGVQVADTHHHAAQCDKWCGGKAKFFGAQQSGDDHITAGHQLAVSL